MSQIVDSLLYEGVDESFATNKKNRWLQPGEDFLAGRGRKSMWRAGRWHVKKAGTYLRRLNTFKRQLMVNMHVWGGQPGRGPEMTTLKHCDTQQVVRNVFVFDGQLLMITDRDKRKAIRGLGRKVTRFLPERLGKMVVIYVA